MELAHPVWQTAFALIPVMAVLVLFGATARRKARRVFQRTAAPMPRRTVLRMAALCAVVGLMVLTLADPRWGEKTRSVQRLGSDIMFVLDVSQSMAAEDIEANRLERAKREIRGLLPSLVGTRVGLVVFAGEAKVSCPLTVDHTVFSHILDDASVFSLPKGGTNIARGLAEARDALANDADGKAIVLVTDGEQTGSEDKIAGMGDLGAIPVFVVGVGTTGGAKIPTVALSGRQSFVTDDAGQEVVTRLTPGPLAALAATTGGAYQSTEKSAFPLDDLYDKRIRHVEANAYGTGRVTDKPTRYQLPLLAALALIELMWFPRRTRRSRRAQTGATAAAVLVLAMVWAGPKLASGQDSMRPPDLAQARRGIQTRPEDPVAWYNWGTALHESGRLVESVQALRKAETLLTQGKAASDPYLERDTSYNLGNSWFYASGDLKGSDDRVKARHQAIDAYAKALARDPQDAQARWNLAVVLRSLGGKVPRQSNTSKKPGGSASREGSKGPEKKDEGKGKKNKKTTKDESGNDRPQEQDKGDGLAGNRPGQDRLPSPEEDTKINQALDKAEETQRKLDKRKRARKRTRLVEGW